MKKAYLKKKWVLIVIVSLFLSLINSTQFSASGQEVTFDEIKSSYHDIAIGSPKNGSVYYKNQIPLNVTVDYIYTESYVPWRVLSRLFYSIDDGPAKILAIVSNGYTTPIPYIYSTEIIISDIQNGLHKLEVVAEFSVDVGHVYVASYNRSSSPVAFSVFRDLPTPSPEPSLPSSTQLASEEPQQLGQEAILGVVVIVAVLAVGLGLLLYLIRRK